MSTEISPRRRRDIISALRRGTVPERGLDVLAVGLDHLDAAIDEELTDVEQGGAHVKAVRGEYGSGKTFFARWLTERAKQRGLVTAEIQISETETPLHKLETVYRRITESLSTGQVQSGAFRDVIDGWSYVLHTDVEQTGQARDARAQLAAAEELLEKRLAAVTKSAPAFATALRAYYQAVAQGDMTQAEGLLAWLGGQPHVASAVRRRAGIRGELDHFGALGFLQGLLTVLRDSDYKGLVVVLDEVETLQRVRSDVREKSLNALRQLADEIDGGRFPGMYLVMTGTPAFFEGAQGITRLPPLAQRLDVNFSTDPRFDNPRAPQIRLRGFTEDSLREVGSRVRDIFVGGLDDGARVRAAVDDGFVADLADSVAGELGGKTGVAPRLFLRALVDVLDRVEQFPDFDPRRDYHLQIRAADLTESERSAAALGDVRRGAASVDDIELDLP